MIIPVINSVNQFRYWENRPWFDAVEACDDGGRSWGTWAKSHCINMNVSAQEHWEKIYRGMRLPNV